MKNLIFITVLLMLSKNHQLAAQNAIQASIISLNLSAEEGNHTLAWTTEKEVNTSYFVVERSKDQLNYFAIGNIKAAGYSLISKSYELENFDSESTFYYYRVVLVSMEGGRICSLTLSTEPHSENGLMAHK